MEGGFNKAKRGNWLLK